MATATKKCKICGKDYEYCRTNRPSDIFRWQDVACCVEHGQQYFEKILKSRELSIPIKSQNYDFSDLIEDDEDELFEKDFEDDEDILV